MPAQMAAYVDAGDHKTLSARLQPLRDLMKTFQGAAFLEWHAGECVPILVGIEEYTE